MAKFQDKVLFGVVAVTLVVLFGSCGRHTDTVVGPKGDTGAQGPAGTNGVGCSQQAIEATNAPGDPSENGGSVITCDNGSVLILNGAKGDTGASGQNGSDGANGTNGTNGVDGQAGAPGTSVVGVKFCPQYQGNGGYPEYGFNIGGELFATYWDGHNAWTALLSPGYYSSTSTGAPCNFTVNQDGSISN